MKYSKKDKQYFPSVYKLTKDRPKMEFGMITLKHKYKVLDEEEKKSKAKRDDKALKAAKKKMVKQMLIVRKK